jgi:hypothetical protein
MRISVGTKNGHKGLQVATPPAALKISTPVRRLQIYFGCAKRFAAKPLKIGADKFSWMPGATLFTGGYANSPV